MIERIHILAIDDNDGILKDYRKVFDSESPKNPLDSLESELFGEKLPTHSRPQFRHVVETASQGEEGLWKYVAALDADPFDVVFVDMRMPPGWDGLKTIQKIWENDPTQFIVLSTAYSDYSLDKMREVIGERPNFLILRKPFEPEEILQIVHAVGATLTSQARDQKVLARELARALEQEELSLVYQPILDLESKHVTGFEALCRWIKDGKVIAHPDVFIAAAETHGLIGRLGDWVARKSIEAARRIRIETGLDLVVNFNAAPIQLTHTFVQHVKSLASEFQIAPSQIGIEITETQLSTDNVECLDSAQEFLAAGFHVLIDDFGTGFSSLNAISTLPVDSIKIDRVFTSKLQTDKVMPIIIRGVLEVAKALERKCIAEGIETEEQAQILKSLGCKLGQGYLFSKPVSLDAAIEFAQKNSEGSTRKAA